MSKLFPASIPENRDDDDEGDAEGDGDAETHGKKSVHDLD